MNGLDLPNQIELTILGDICLVFFKLNVDLGPQVAYNVTRPLSKEELKRILLCDNQTFESMEIAPLDPPVVNARTAQAIANIITKQLRKTEFQTFGNAHSWKIVPTKCEYHNDEEVRLTLVVTP